MMPRRRSVRRSRVRRERLIPSLRTAYTPHDLRRALRRMERWRRVAPELGIPVPGRGELEELLRRGRAAGLLGRRRLVAVRVRLDANRVEKALWATGARSVDELVVAALLRVALREGR